MMAVGEFTCDICGKTFGEKIAWCKLCDKQMCPECVGEHGGTCPDCARIDKLKRLATQADSAVRRLVDAVDNLYWGRRAKRLK
jgi:hypothetical protein